MQMGLVLPFKCLESLESRSVLSNTIATSIMWLYKFNLKEIQLRNEFLSHNCHISRAQQSPVANGYRIVQCRVGHCHYCRTFRWTMLLNFTSPSGKPTGEVGEVLRGAAGGEQTRGQGTPQEVRTSPRSTESPRGWGEVQWAWVGGVRLAWA